MSGLMASNHSRMAQEYQLESPYVYSLFKIHKLSKDDISNKKIPPNRLVHASKYSPVYRIEKWCSPFLTTISREYCKEEFILDTRHLVKDIKELNTSEKLRNENINLFTLDVEKLYPSIQPQLALAAIEEAFRWDKSTDSKTKTACLEIVKFSFKNSYISYKDKTFCFFPSPIAIHWIL